MLDQLAANIRVNLKFYRRNRLLLGMGLVFLLIALIFASGSLLFSTSTGHFELMHQLFDELSTFAFIFVAAVGLILITVHVRGRGVKLIFTKPCTPEVWLGSAFASAVLLAFILYSGIVALTFALSVYWGVPF